VDVLPKLKEYEPMTWLRMKVLEINENVNIEDEFKKECYNR
jgi:hypothetical protein